MLEQLNVIERAALESLSAITDQAALDAWRVANGGRSSPLMLVFSGLEKLSKEKRPVVGAAANRVKVALESSLEERGQAVERGFGQAAMQAPLVPLRDHTWTPYVPADALTPRRLLEVWYPTDVDTGALHLSRLAALEPRGPLTTYLLHDHEDNLFLHGEGMANEPVYNQHATAYLLRDDVQPAIRAFYSMLACAFSHSVLEPVEHRWGWGQYFGPPSTDGAWFDLYRHILIQEQEDEALFLCRPRRGSGWRMASRLRFAVR